MATHRLNAACVLTQALLGSVLSRLISMAFCLWTASVFGLFHSSLAQTLKAELKRPVTVQDGIELTRLGDPEYWSGASSEGRVAQFSPDGKHFVIVLQRGNLEKNTNEYSLLLFKTSEAFASPKPDTLLRMASSSNRPAISKVRWLDDNRTVMFLGENPGESTQIFSLDTRNRRLRYLTHHSSEIYSFDATTDGSEIVFLAEPSADVARCRHLVRQSGLVVEDQELSDLVRDPCQVSPENQRFADVFVQRAGKSARRIPIPNPIRNDGPLLLSPNGGYALVGETVKKCPELWRGYRSEYVQDCFAANVRPGGRARYRLRRYLLIELASNQAHPLLDVPSFVYLPKASWASDSQSVWLNRTYLPLDAVDSTELSERQKNRYDVKVDIASGSSQKVALSEGEKKRKEPPIEVTLEESFNAPFRIYVSDTGGGRKAMLMDLNPQISTIDLGQAELFEWKGAHERSWKGVLYFPAGYVAGKRYPLVIQTHGFNPRRFSMDGLNDWSSAFAARPLAAEGFVVLQAGDWSFNTVDEGPNLMVEYESAVDALDKRELIDRTRVGITGFSRTVYDVGFTLTHSSFPYKAAVLADGIDACYFSYVANADMSDVIALNGGKPYGDGLRSWEERAPCFNLDKVHTPIRFLSFSDSGAVLQNWEWFSVLQRLNKPIELVLLPAASHQLVKPWDRMTAQQGLVDWFRFWLKEEEDRTPAKSAQYVRWRELRRLKEVDGNSLGSMDSPVKE